MENFKHDQDKLRMDLLPFDAIDEVAKVLTFGAKKYKPNSWRGIDDAKNRYTAALLRHLSAHQQGEKYDKESGLLHLSHVACNALFLISLEKK